MSDTPRSSPRWQDSHVESAMSAVFEASGEGIVVLLAIRDESDAVVDFELVMVSATAERLLGNSATELVGIRLSTAQTDVPAEQLARYADVVETNTTWSERTQLPGLGDRWFDTSATGFLRQGLVVMFRDVTEERSHEELLRGLHKRQKVLEREALRDSLTGLGNRALVLNRLEHAMSRLDHHASSVAVMFIDLDGLKVINDTYGHAAGDAVLIEIGRRLLAVTRGYDTVGRIGGDEFLVLCEDMETIYDIDQIARRFVEQCAVPVDFGGSTLPVAASVGVAVSAPQSLDAAALLDEADTAMYRAKARGGGRVEYFDAALHDEVLARHDREVGLEQAIVNDELDIAFIPVVGRDGAARAVRARAGWTHRRHGFIDHRTLAEVAEKADNVPLLTDWVLGHALAHIASPNPDPSNCADCFDIVDVDDVMFSEASFAARVAKQLDEQDVDPRALCLAVDGTYLAQHLDVLKPLLDEVAASGVRIARRGDLTPNPSFTYLRELPIDIVMLERDLTDHLFNTDVELLGVVVDTVKGGGRLVMASSANADQFAALTSLGVDLIEPPPADAIERQPNVGRGRLSGDGVSRPPTNS